MYSSIALNILGTSFIVRLKMIIKTKVSRTTSTFALAWQVIPGDRTARTGWHEKQNREQATCEPRLCPALTSNNHTIIGRQCRHGSQPRLHQVNTSLTAATDAFQGNKGTERCKKLYNHKNSVGGVSRHIYT